MPIGQMPGRIAELDASKPTVVYCAGGWRSSVGASLLRNAGFADVLIVFAQVEGKLTAFIVDADSPGVSTGAEDLAGGA